jgi:hypothetical protein
VAEGGHALSTVMFVPLPDLEFLHAFTAYFTGNDERVSSIGVYTNFFRC